MTTPALSVLESARAARTRVAALLPAGAVVGRVSAVTEDGALIAVSGSGSQLRHPRIEDVRAPATYGRSSAINKLLIVNAEPFAGRTAVLLLAQDHRLLRTEPAMSTTSAPRSRSLPEPPRG